MVLDPFHPLFSEFPLQKAIQKRDRAALSCPTTMPSPTRARCELFYSARIPNGWYHVRYNQPEPSNQ